jgi:hypothetical protein
VLREVPRRGPGVQGRHPVSVPVIGIVRGRRARVGWRACCAGCRRDEDDAKQPPGREEAWSNYRDLYFGSPAEFAARRRRATGNACVEREPHPTGGRQILFRDHAQRAGLTQAARGSQMRMAAGEALTAPPRPELRGQSRSSRRPAQAPYRGAIRAGRSRARGPRPSASHWQWRTGRPAPRGTPRPWATKAVALIVNDSSNSTALAIWLNGALTSATAPAIAGNRETSSPVERRR